MGTVKGNNRISHTIVILSGVTDGGQGANAPPLAARGWGPFLETGPLNSDSFAT